MGMDTVGVETRYPRHGIKHRYALVIKDKTKNPNRNEKTNIGVGVGDAASEIMKQIETNKISVKMMRKSPLDHISGAETEGESPGY